MAAAEAQYKQIAQTTTPFKPQAVAALARMHQAQSDLAAANVAVARQKQHERVAQLQEEAAERQREAAERRKEEAELKWRHTPAGRRQCGADCEAEKRSCETGNAGAPLAGAMFGEMLNDHFSGAIMGEMTKRNCTSSLNVCLENCRS